MNVANKSIIRKLTMRLMKANKRRNFFLAAAVALTAFMLTSVFSVGSSLYETIQITPYRSEGILAHAFLANQTPEQVETLRSLDYVRRVNTMYRVGVGYMDGSEFAGAIYALNENSWRYSQAPVYTDIVGSIATAENEIMLSRAHLEQMGIDNPYIGMEIPMEFIIGDFHAIDELGERYSKTFVLSAIYTEYVSLNPGNVYTPFFVSEAFAERYGQLSHENIDIRIIFTNPNRAVEYAERLAQTLNLDYEQDIVIHPALAAQSDSGFSTMYIAIAIIAIFFMFVGFLLIYNVMYISVSKDVRFYGLLKSMGTTPHQLRRVVNGQVLLLCILGVPIGLAASVITSFWFVPAMVVGNSSVQTVISFSPLIYIGGIVFTLATAYIGASISARKAAKISPIEAVRYTGEMKIKLKPHTSANGKPSRMALRNIFRERKRATVVLLSLFLGITVFIGVMAIADSMDIAGGVDDWYDHDISIANSNLEGSDFGLVGMDKEFIEEISNLLGVSEVREQTAGIAWFDFPQELSEHVNSFMTIIGIDRAYAEELFEKLERSIDIEAFERGEIALFDETPAVYGFGAGNMLYEYFPTGIELQLEMGRQARIPVNTQVAGYAVISHMTGYIINAGGSMELIMSNTFLDNIGAKGGVNSLDINIEKGMEEPVNAAVSAMTNERGMAMGSKFEITRMLEEGRFTMYVLGAVISGVLALIGLFNFINLISVGLFTRKREFAALESIGMTRKQMRLMLRWEGAIYWISSIAASITAGTGVAYGLFWLIHNQDAKMYPQFIYPVLPTALVFGLIIVICTVTPEICYRNISKSTLVERLRETE
jgi:putative ABC transport system permease protein